MKINLLLLILFFNTPFLYPQKSTIETINETMRNILDIFGKKKESVDNNIIDKKNNISENNNSSVTLNNVCKELCVHNFNKTNARVELKDKSNLKSTIFAVMSKDKSCQFDFQKGIYILYIYLNDKLVKSTDIKIDEEFKTIEIPE
jgi:hypothetical protein